MHRKAGNHPNQKSDRMGKKENKRRRSFSLRLEVDSSVEFVCFAVSSLSKELQERIESLGTRPTIAQSREGPSVEI